MTQHLRYLGPTTAQFRTGHVYLILLSIDRESIVVCEPWNKTYSYRNLAHLLQFWEPAFPYVPAKGDDLTASPAYNSCLI
ncbi:hypothetical protein [Hymenobacter wooponensis]|uniref:Uncharacterized protein n=1 Tax=Hymenobacter wooponensis TaxID=1525360 RepID=A0A4Z0MLB2_9BACT|nr:hypothetical protein [Hymenobacter wooponensis]TGD80276.1 hypothetical protein EU557_10550 [Hymenobacter wooponensis]